MGTLASEASQARRRFPRAVDVVLHSFRSSLLAPYGLSTTVDPLTPDLSTMLGSLLSVTLSLVLLVIFAASVGLFMAGGLMVLQPAGGSTGRRAGGSSSWPRPASSGRGPRVGACQPQRLVCLWPRLRPRPRSAAETRAAESQAGVERAGIPAAGCARGESVGWPRRSRQRGSGVCRPAVHRRRGACVVPPQMLGWLESV